MAKKRSVTKPLQIGRAMAAETLKRRLKALSKRRKALAASETLVTRSVVAAPLLAPVAAAVELASAGVLIAEGDSWFDYPLNDVLSKLEDEHGYDVVSVSHRGDNVEDMAYSDGQLDAFARAVEKSLRTGIIPKAILLSGGGNDIAGDEFAILLNHAASNIAGLNEQIVSGVMDRLHDSYATILGAITKLCIDKIGKSVPIVTHGYDYSVPDGRGFLGGFGPLPGPWLEPGFRRKGYGSPDQNKAIVVDLINRFNDVLGTLANHAQFPHVHHVNLRNTLSTDKEDYKKHWANELHPTPKGWGLVADRFAAVIKPL